MKQIKDYLHLYLGCDCMIKYFYGKEWVETKMTMQLLIEHYYHGGFSHNPEFVKPILRPLSDMTDEEIESVYHCSSKELVMHVRLSLLRVKHNPEATFLLLKYGVDIFGLIEAGLAIDKTLYKAVKEKA